MNVDNFFIDDDNKCEKSLEGKMLVASPHMNDPFFERSLVYICAHDSNGAIGIIVNQKIGSLSAVDILKNQKKESSLLKNNKKYPVLFGGPVNSDLVVALSLNKSQEESFGEHGRANMHINIGSFFEEIVRGKSKPSKLILAKGVSAWENAQLETELYDNSWFIIPSSLQLLFSQKIKYKWDSVIKDLGLQNFNHLVHYSGNS